MAIVTSKSRPECPRCGSHQVYHRVKTNTFRCEECGYIWDAPKEVKGE